MAAPSATKREKVRRAASPAIVRVTSALVEASRRMGRRQAFASACTRVAERLGFVWECGSAAAADEEVRSSLEALSEAELRDPARTLGIALEGALEAQRLGGSHLRKAAGAYHTPDWLVGHVLDSALMAVPERTQGEDVRVLDPACGSGVFLVAAMRRSPAAQVHGIDLDPVAVMLARFAVWVESGGTLRWGEIEQRIVCDDALLADIDAFWPGVRFDAVVGNPPFLNQLETTTTHGRERAAALRERYGELARCYADASALFLEMGVRSTAPGGRVSMVQPQSLLASRDASPVRRSVLQRAALTDLWATREHAFSASVLVCVPTLRVGVAQGAIVRKEGPELRALQPFDPAPRRLESMETWAPLVAAMHRIPEFSLRTERPLGDFAAATADFRDQFYGLRGRIIEDAETNPGLSANFPKLITTGLIDVASCSWGVRPTRIDKRIWVQPRLSLRLLEDDPELLRWARARLVPKILLATQTRVLEAAVDEGGEWIPVTPLITVIPRESEDIWRVAAALCSPVLSAWALREYAGAGLSAAAIKLSAKQVMRLPAPGNTAQWSDAADAFRFASGAGSDSARADSLDHFSRLMCEAYQLDDGTTAQLIEWWRARLPGRHMARSVPASTELT